MPWQLHGLYENNPIKCAQTLTLPPRPCVLSHSAERLELLVNQFFPPMLTCCLFSVRLYGFISLKLLSATVWDQPAAHIRLLYTHKHRFLRTFDAAQAQQIMNIPVNEKRNIASPWIKRTFLAHTEELKTVIRLVYWAWVELWATLHKISSLCSVYTYYSVVK